MKKYHVLHNPLAGHGKEKVEQDFLNVMFGAENLTYTNMLEIFDYEEYFSKIPLEEEIILCGGDGTINHFINKTKHITIQHTILYLGNGSGNDFLRDVKNGADGLLPLNDYIKDLPNVTVKGNDYQFINGVGFGIDGYCCEEGDRLRASSTKPVNYTQIAIKGLLFHFKPVDATVIVDGKEYFFKKVWIAPTMNGKYYGGGMIPAPMQTRQSDKLSVLIFHGSGKLKTLMIFPSLFKGEHVKYKKHASVLSGHEITVRFSEPRSLQIDGETFLDVSEYTAKK